MDIEHAIDRYLGELSERLDMEQQPKTELLEEMRGHLLDVVAGHLDAGASPERSVQRAVAQFGEAFPLARAMNTVYAGWGATDAIVFTALPVMMGLLLRWLVFAPDGTALGWAKILSSFPFWIVALAALLIPLLRFPRFRYALASWIVFWGITVLFVVLG